MEKQSFKRRFLSPLLILFAVMAGSWVVYNLAWRLGVPSLHRILAFGSGTLLFLSVSLGALFVYSLAYFRGASLGERVLASLVIPFLWATKECIRLYVSFSFLECLYYYLNPLNLWLLFGICAEMALAEMLCRKRLKSKGEPIRVMEPVAVCVFLASLFLVVSLYAWGEGENVYVIFLEGYRDFFGAGTGVPVP